MANEHGHMTPVTPPKPVGTGISLTERSAAKIKGLLEAEKKDPAEYGLRVGVIGGGCSGFQYMLDFDKKRENDQVFETHGVKVIVDPKSLMFMRGSVVEYEETLMGAGFKIQNPNVKGSCGCGSSFSV
jgi:iron-sulfur cluster assembly protein